MVIEYNMVSESGFNQSFGLKIWPKMWHENGNLFIYFIEFLFVR